MERKLTAILSADVKGYSRLMGEDDEATVRTLTAHRETMTRLIQQHRGRVVDSPGDNLLAEFASVVDAVRCAVEIQRELRTRNAELPSERKMEFRIGINVGDVIVEGERIYGDGVNIAARLEGLAEAGGICISGTVYDQIENKLTLSYEYVGEQTVKNIAKPVRVWRVRVESETAVSSVEEENQKSKIKRQKAKIESQEFRRMSTVRLSRTALVAAGLLIVGGLVALLYPSFLPFIIHHSSFIIQEAQPPLLPLPDKPSIIVLPFVNMSEDPKQEYFSDGLTEVLTSNLSQLSGLFVIARNSAFTYKGKAVKVQDVGREMGVRYVLEGSVQKADQRVRITTQLIEATTGYHLWSEQYDRPLKDIFALQDEIVQKIVTTLRLQLTLQGQGHIVRKHTDNLEAYDAFLRGLEYFVRFTKEANVQARQMFEKALALDPQYAEAYTTLGQTYLLEWIFRWNAAPQTLERAFELAQKALALNDSLPGAHSLLSYVSAQKQQYDQALAEGERAIALDPNNADSYAAQADALYYAGRPEAMLRMIEQAMRLNPHYPPWYLEVLGMAYCLTGRYTEAIATLKEAISRNPNHLGAHLDLALSYMWQWASQQSADAQTLAQALAAAQRVLALNDAAPWGYTLLGGVYLWQKQYEQALAEMERAVALDPTEAWSYAALAVVLSCMDRTEDALEAAAQALRLKPFIADGHLAEVGAAYAVAGRYAEAVAPLQRYLSHYPNILPAHLTLAVVYSELGKEAEARAEAAEVLRINPNFSLEVHKQRVSIKDPAVVERQLAGLRKAGLK